MDPASALHSVMTKPFRFSGRATRPEYWWFFLLDVGITAVLCTIDGYLLMLDQTWMADPLSLNLLDFFTVWWILLAAFPRISLTVRRLHDANMSGFLLLLVLLPLIGNLILMILCALPSDENVNQHGQPPGAGGTYRKDGRTNSQSDHLRAYGALVQMEQRSNPEYRQAFEERRKQEVRALYEERILGKSSRA